jgi:hypothetical protein
MHTNTNENFRAEADTGKISRGVKAGLAVMILCATSNATCCVTP